MNRRRAAFERQRDASRRRSRQAGVGESTAGRTTQRRGGRRRGGEGVDTVVHQVVAVRRRWWSLRVRTLGLRVSHRLGWSRLTSAPREQEGRGWRDGRNGTHHLLSLGAHVWLVRAGTVRRDGHGVGSRGHGVTDGSCQARQSAVSPGGRGRASDPLHSDDTRRGRAGGVLLVVVVVSGELCRPCVGRVRLAKPEKASGLTSGRHASHPTERQGRTRKRDRRKRTS